MHLLLCDAHVLPTLHGPRSTPTTNCAPMPIRVPLHSRDISVLLDVDRAHLRIDPEFLRHVSIDVHCDLVGLFV